MRLGALLPAPAKRLARIARRRAIETIAPIVKRRERTRALAGFPPRPAVAAEPVRLLVGPANFAGQGDAWARAARTVSGVTSTSFAVVTGALDFPCDYPVPVADYRNRWWQLDQRDYVPKAYTHVLVEAERPIFGLLYGGDVGAELGQLQRWGLHTALICHGSDIRLPSAHAQRVALSPFTDAEGWDLTPRLEKQARRNLAILSEFDGPIFVSTPDLLDDVPRATWCPVIVDPQRWASTEPVLERQRPVVVHAPSSSKMKGSDLVDPIAQRLADEGLIDYRRIEGVAPQEMPGIYGAADIVLDQFRLGSYGVASCEAMAAGRLTVAHVTDEVRDRVRQAAGVDLPIVEAVPDSLESVLRGLLADRDAARAQAALGPQFIATAHDGRLSAAALRTFVEPTRG